MCDYSLHAVKNRLAVTGESLTIHKFHTGSKGLASPADVQAARPSGLKRIWNFLMLEDPRAAERNIPAVCVPPGARLRLSGIPTKVRLDRGVGETEDVTFTQLNVEPFRYRDAVRFDNGQVCLLQKFTEGVRVEALQLEIADQPHSVERDCDHPFRVTGEACPNCGERAEELVAVPTNPGEWRLYSNG